MVYQWYIPSPESHHDSENAFKIIEILKDYDVKVYTNKYRPFGLMDYSFLSRDYPSFLYGHLGCIRDCQRRNIDLSPFIWCDFDYLKCSNYYSFWGDFLVQKKYTFLPLSEVKRNIDFLYDVYGKNDEIFIRPNSNDKVFSGTIISKKSFNYWYSYISHDVSLNELVLVSAPQSIQQEYRFIVKDTKVVTGSTYKDGQILPSLDTFPLEASIFAEHIATSNCLFNPHPMYVMDIAKVDGYYNLLEIGSINAAGLYGCDLRKFVVAVLECIEREFVSRREIHESVRCSSS